MKALMVLLMFLQSVEISAAESAQDYAYGMPIHANAQEALQEIDMARPRSRVCPRATS